LKIGTVEVKVPGSRGLQFLPPWTVPITTSLRSHGRRISSGPPESP